jgi:hypothetical protein
MIERIRKLVVVVGFGAVVGVVWILGAMHAEMDRPVPTQHRVDPAIIQRAMNAGRAAEAAVEAAVEYTGHCDSGGFYYIFAS